MRMNINSHVNSSIIDFKTSSQSLSSMPNVRIISEGRYKINCFNMKMVMINHGALLELLMLSKQGNKILEG